MEAKCVSDDIVFTQAIVHPHAKSSTTSKYLKNNCEVSVGEELCNKPGTSLQDKIRKKYEYFCKKLNVKFEIHKKQIENLEASPSNKFESTAYECEKDSSAISTIESNPQQNEQKSVSLQTDMVDQDEQQEEEKAKMEQTIKEMRDEIETLTQDNQELKQSNHQLQQSNNKLEESNHELEQSNHELQSQLQTANDNFNSANTELFLANNKLQHIAEFTGDQLKCGVCLGLVTYPVMLNCKHIFCKLCVANCKKYKRSCPYCRAFLTSESNIEILDAYLDKILQLLPGNLKEERQKAIEDYTVLVQEQEVEYQHQRPIFRRELDELMVFLEHLTSRVPRQAQNSQ